MLYQSPAAAPRIAPSSRAHTAQTHEADTCHSSLAGEDSHPGTTVQIPAWSRPLLV